ncbi:MAG: hypothetical protein J4432_03085 [DPANN group archaeon]|nr:hypothetical protein [DPANN group archaeon]
MNEKVNALVPVLLIGLGLATLIYSVMGFSNQTSSNQAPAATVNIGQEHSKEAFAQAVAAQAPQGDFGKCATPEGYSDDDWKTHMGHHPDLYKECLE